MKNVIVFFIAVLFMSCGTSQQQKEKEEKHEHNSSVTALQLNNGVKWKADSTTHSNVSRLVQLVSDSNYKLEKNKELFSDQLQNRLDTLVKQCKMTGPDHDALHAWLQPVLHDVKELKESDGKFDSRFTELETDVRSFYDYFD